MAQSNFSVRPGSSWLGRSGCPRHPDRPGWLELAALYAVARPGWLDLLTLGVLVRPDWFEVRARDTLARPGWVCSDAI